MIPTIDGKYTDYTLDMQPFPCKVAGNHHSLRDNQVICRSRQQVGTAGRCGHLPSGAKGSQKGQWVTGTEDECWTEEGGGLGNGIVSKWEMYNYRRDARFVRPNVKALCFNACLSGRTDRASLQSLFRHSLI